MRKWLLSFIMSGLLTTVTIGIIWFIALHVNDGTFVWCLISMMMSMTGLAMVIYAMLPEGKKVNGKK